MGLTQINVTPVRAESLQGIKCTRKSPAPLQRWQGTERNALKDSYVSNSPARNRNGKSRPQVPVVAEVNPDLHVVFFVKKHGARQHMRFRKLRIEPFSYGSIVEF
jgi:hypothetical protein